MESFPFLLFRKAGADLNNSFHLNAPLLSVTSDHLLQLISGLSHEKAALKATLAHYFQTSVTKKENLFLINILRNLHTGKSLRRKDINKAEANLPVHLFSHLKKITADEKHLENINQQFHNHYQKTKTDHIQALLKLAENDSFKSALLLSSSVLSAQLKTIRHKNPEHFSKKEYQTVTGLLKYYSRMTHKTSPFSKFGTTGRARIASNPGITTTRPERNQYDYICWNHRVFQLLEEAIRQHPKLKKQLFIQLNNSLTEQENLHLFLQLTENNEHFQLLHKNELTEYLVHEFNKKDNIKYTTLINDLKENPEASSGEIEAFLEQLSDIGFLETGTGISDDDPYWPEKIIRLFEYSDAEFPEDFKFVTEQLNQLIFLKKNFKKDVPDSRSKYIEQAYIHLSAVFNYLKNERQYSKQASCFPIAKTAIVYEDCFADFDVDINNVVIAQTSNLLGKLCQHIPHFPVSNFDHSRIQSYYASHFQQAHQVNFLTFYFGYCKFLQKNNYPIIQSAYFIKWKEQASKYFTNLLVKPGNEFHITVEHLFDINHAAGFKTKKTGIQQSWNFFIQFHQNGNRQQAIINNVFTGYGKMFGRFLDKLEPEVYQAIRRKIKDQFPNVVTARIKDHSYYNPDFHPMLTDIDIVLPGGNYSQKKTVWGPGDLVVVYEKTSGHFYLKIRETGQTVVPLDLGFQSPANLPAVSRFLLAFSPATIPGTNLINKAINDGVKMLKQGKYPLVLPRIIFEKSIILQRKTWVFETENIPRKRHAEREADFYLRLKKWRLAQGIDLKVFIRFKSLYNNINTKPKYNYKPQYIDFESPLYIRLFYKAVSGENRLLLLSEVLPGYEDSVQAGDQRFVTEFLIQLDGH